MKQLLVFIFLIQSFGSALMAQTFTEEEVKADLLQLKTKIRSFNPGLDQFNPDFDRKVDSLVATIQSDLNSYQAYQLTSKVCAFSNEGHFAIGQWSDQVHDGLAKDRDPFLPFSVFIVGERIYVNRDFSNEERLAIGDEVVTINGRSSEEILRLLRSVTPSDGSITTYQYRKIEDNFPWYYFFYVEQPALFELTIMRDGVKEKMSVQALTKTERQDNFKARNEPAPEKELSLDDAFDLRFEDSYACLHLKSFDYRLVEKHKLKAKKFYQEIFQKIKASDTDNLIIDLRGNTGGRKQFGEGIVPFILKEDLEVPFLVKTTSWKGRKKTVKPVKPSKDVFKGNCYLLVDGYTYSVGGVIARYLKELGGAVVVGEETGTRYEGFVAGSKQYTTLTNTNIRIGVPCYLNDFPLSELQETTNRGLLPDHIVQPLLRDRIQGNDPVMDFVVELIGKRN